MAVAFRREWLDELAPQALLAYRDAFNHANATLLPWGVLENEKRLSHFLAQVLHESSGLVHVQENLSYSAQRLMVVWPHRFPNLDLAKQYEHQPMKLANFVYGGRLGNTEPYDGHRYIGRGLIQLTGRTNYARIGAMLGVDLVSDPTLAATPRYVLVIAAAIWRSSGCNEAADANDIRRVTKCINGGYIGLLSRIRWHQKVLKVMGLPEMPDYLNA